MKKVKNLKKIVLVFWICIFSMTTIEAIAIAERNLVDPVEKELLAQAIYGEARNQGKEGMEAVGNVVLNRLNKNTYFGGTLEEVIKKPEHFSVFNPETSPDKQWNQDIIDNYEETIAATKDDPYFIEALEIAEGLLTGKIEDNTGGATHYYNPDITTPWWADSPKMTKLKKIGNHTFLLEA